MKMNDILHMVRLYILYILIMLSLVSGKKSQKFFENIEV